MIKLKTLIESMGIPVNPKPKYVYHATSIENIPSIKSHGLVPKVGRVGSGREDDGPMIFLFPSLYDTKNALQSEWLSFPKGIKIVILKVKTDGIDLEYYNNDPDIGEYISYNTIPIKNIVQIIDGGLGKGYF